MPGKRSQKTTKRSSRSIGYEYQDIFTNAPIGIFTATPAGRYLGVNPAMANIFGYESPQEMIDSIGNNWQQMFVEREDVNEAILLLEERGYLINHEVRHFHRDSSIIWVSVNVRTVRDEGGNVLFYHGFITDITGRKRVEEELQESEQELAAVLETQQEMICRFRPDTTLTYVNKAYCRWFGIPKEQLIGMRFLELVPKEVHADILKRIGALSADNPARTHSHRVYRKDGTLGWQEWTNYVIMDSRNKVVEYQAVGRDITDRKKAEDALIAEKHLYDTLINSLPGIFYHFDQRGRFEKWNKNLEAVSGFTAEEISNMHPQDFFTGADKQRIAKTIRDIFVKGKGTVEAELLSKDGRRIPHLFTGKKLALGDGEYIIGMGTDISERKRVEEELREHRDRLERLVDERTAELAKSEMSYRNLVDNALVGVYRTNLNGDHFFGNEAIAKIFDFGSREELLSTMVPERYKHPEDRIIFLERLKEKGRLTNYELELVTKTGRKKHVLLNATLEGDVISGMMLDITDRKEFERELTMKSLSLEELNTALKVLLEQRERDKEELEEKIYHNVKELVLPYIETLKQKHLDEEQRMYFDILEKNLNNIVSPFLKKMTSLHSNLTPTEIRVANLIREGKTAKEIARMFCVAETSINTHKQRIRNKLGLTHHKINLKTYLMALQ